MGDEVKTRVSIDGADEAIGKIQKLTDAEKKMFEAFDQGSRASDKATAATERQEQSLIGATKQMLSYAAAIGAAMTALEALSKRIDESVGKMRGVAELSRGLAANIGGNAADEVMKDVNVIAAESGIGVEGRNNLVQFLSAATDARENLTGDQLKNLAQRGALIQKATGVGGAKAFNVMQSIGANLGFNDDEAVSAAVQLMNEGFSTDVIQEMVEKGRDPRILALMSNARGQGLNAEKIGRPMTSLLGSLTATDDSGAVAPELAEVGVTADMKPMDRLSLLMGAPDRGEITPGQFSELTGGQGTASLMGPIGKVLRDQAGLDRRAAALRDVKAPAGEIAKIMSSRSQWAASSLNTVELEAQLKLEQEGLSPGNINKVQYDTFLKSMGLDWLGDMPVLKQVKNAKSIFSSDQTVENASQEARDRVRAMQGRPTSQDVVEESRGREVVRFNEDGTRGPSMFDSLDQHEPGLMDHVLDGLQGAGGKLLKGLFGGGGARGGSGARGTAGPGTVIINNYTNSILHGTNPAMAPADVKRQD